MKILNHTDWDTKQLQRIFKWCLKQEGLTGKLLTIEVVNQKQTRTFPTEFVSGYAYYGSGDFSRNYVRIRIPKGAIHEFSVAGTVLHELAHTRGVKHKEMGRDFYHGKLDAESYGSEALLQKKPAKPKQDIKAIRKAKAEAKVKEYEHKLKRTQTILKKWKKKVKYYQNRGNQNEMS